MVLRKALTREWPRDGRIHTEGLSPKRGENAAQQANTFPVGNRWPPSHTCVTLVRASVCHYGGARLLASSLEYARERVIFNGKKPCKLPCVVMAIIRADRMPIRSDGLRVCA